MGLDCYLNARKYVSPYSDEEFSGKLNKLTESITGWKAKEIVFEVGYWRKANAIHNWFVRNVQEGVDDCKEYHVDYDSIVTLYNFVCEVLENREKAEELLPSASGFFFGSTEYDEYYFGDLEDTKNMLKPLVEMIDSKDDSIFEFDFYYRASW